MEVWGPGPVPVRLRINDKPYDLKLEPRTTLLDALREELEITGAKRVCDRGTCGACTVILNGKAVYACSMLAIDAQRQPIETIEGLARPGHLHPLSAAFVEHDAQQCGFCTPGFVMAAKALLDRTPSPDAQGGPSRPLRQLLPLRHLRRHAPGRARRRAAHERRQRQGRGVAAAPPKGGPSHG